MKPTPPKHRGSARPRVNRKRSGAKLQADGRAASSGGASADGPPSPAPGAEDTYRCLVEEMNEGALLLAADGTVRYANAQFANWMHAPQPQLLGAPFKRFFLSDSWSQVERLLQQAKKGSARQELHLDGPTPRPVAVSLRSLHKAHGPGFTAVVTDLTERKASEANLSRINETLESRFRERTAELDRAQAQLMPLYRTLQAHTACSRALLQAQDEPAFLNQVCRIVAETCGYALVWIGFAEPDYSVRLVASAGFEQEYLETLHITWDEGERGQGAYGRAIRSGRPEVCANFQTDPRMAPWREEALRRGLASALVLPLQAEGKVFGTITIYAPKPNAFSAEEVELLNRLATDVSQGITTLRLRQANAQAEERLRQLHQRLQYHIQNTPLAVIEFDAELRVSAWSGAAQRLFGWTAEEVVGRALWNIPWICEEDRGKVQKVSDALESGQTLRSVSPNRNLTKDGRVVWCEWYNSALTDTAGKMQSIQALVLDVTERRQAEAALRSSEEQLRTLADSIPNLAWWGNADGYLTWYNQRWYDYTGTTPEQMQGWGWQSVHDPEMLPRVIERWQASLATGEPFEMELPLRGKDGAFRWFLTRAIPLRNGAGQVQRWFGTNTDVTDEREARLVLTRSKAELESLVTERTAKLQELVGELEHFSYTITHDMRAPLRSMRGFAELVLELCDGCVQEEQKALLRRIIHSAQRMDLLITDALSYSKAVRQELPLGPVDIGALLRGMLESYPEFQTARAHIELQGEFPPVLGNPAGLTQCFSNILGNAIKFAKPGQTPQIRIWAEEVAGPAGPTPPTPPTEPAPAKRIRLWFADQGIGISKAMLPRVFNMFARGSNEHEGTGIGLALVRKVVDRMGGRVGVESEPGQGSRFWLELLSGDPRQPQPTILPSPPAGAMNIL